MFSPQHRFSYLDPIRRDRIPNIYLCLLSTSSRYFPTFSTRSARCDTLVTSSVLCSSCPLYNALPLVVTFSAHSAATSTTGPTYGSPRALGFGSPPTLGFVWCSAFSCHVHIWKEGVMMRWCYGLLDQVKCSCSCSCSCSCLSIVVLFVVVFRVFLLCSFGSLVHAYALTLYRFTYGKGVLWWYDDLVVVIVVLFEHVCWA